MGVVYDARCARPSFGSLLDVIQTFRHIDINDIWDGVRQEELCLISSDAYTSRNPGLS
jgi:hypothetical protein